MDKLIGEKIEVSCLTGGMNSFTRIGVLLEENNNWLFFDDRVQGKIYLNRQVIIYLQKFSERKQPLPDRLK